MIMLRVFFIHGLYFFFNKGIENLGRNEILVPSICDLFFFENRFMFHVFRFPDHLGNYIFTIRV